MSTAAAFQGTRTCCTLSGMDPDGVWRHGEEGFATTLWMICGSWMVLMLTLMVVDAWKLIAADRSLSASVDGAAAAGANGIDEGAWRDGGALQLDPSRAEQLARDNLATQPDAEVLTTLDIGATPERVTVTADRSVSLMLSSLVGPVTVHASADAVPRRSP